MLSFSRDRFRAGNELKHQMYQPHTVTRNKLTEIISFYFPRSGSPAFLKSSFVLSQNIFQRNYSGNQHIVFHWK